MSPDAQGHADVWHAPSALPNIGYITSVDLDRRIDFERKAA